MIIFLVVQLRLKHVTVSRIVWYHKMAKCTADRMLCYEYAMSLQAVNYRGRLHCRMLIQHDHPSS